MKMQTLMMRISECIDDLSLLLDQIYKFPQKQRQVYFDRIQTMKTKLLTLKGNLRDSNLSGTEKQYKQFYLTTNMLKTEILQQISLQPSVKENKQMNRYKDFKDIRKNYEETMKLIVIKDDEIKQLRQLLFQKQQLLRVNLEEMNHLRQENQLLQQNSRISSFDQSSYELQLERTKKYAVRVESELMDMKIRQEQKDKAFNSAIEEMEKLKIELITANQRIINLDHLVQVNKAKTRVAEDIIKSDRQSESLGDSSLRKQHDSLKKQQDNFKKLREVSQLQYQLGLKNENLRQLQQQNKHLKEDIEVLQNQVEKLQGKINQQKNYALREKQNFKFQQKRLEKQIQITTGRQKELKKALQEGQEKYLVSLNKLNAAEQLRIKVKENVFQNELLNEKIYNLETYIEKLQNDIKSLTKQKQNIIMKEERASFAMRQFQVELYRSNERNKIKEEDLIALSHELQNYKSRIRQYEKELTLKERKQKSIESDLFEQKTKIIKLEQKQKVRNKEIQGLKIKLLRAKIETIHEIRETIN